MKRSAYLLFAILCLATAAFSQSSFTINELIAVKRVGDPQLSPDGRTVAFTIGTVDKAANRTLTQIYTIPMSGGMTVFGSPALEKCA